jgi:mannose-6-phosphate isomerase
MPEILSYPLRFQPIFRRYLWGGRRLASLLGKQLGAGEDYAESWEVVDHGQDQSVVLYGPTSGQTVQQLIATHGHELLGRHARHQAFPLLMKYLDACRTLSVQVHPNDQQAAQLDPPDLGKTEAWIVLAAEPGSKIFAGLKQGVTRGELRRQIDAGMCDHVLHQIEPEVGDCIFLPAGTVHAIGAGLVIAEIQQASDTTFRLYDWNRVDPHGNPRPLHIEQALATIDFSRGPINPQKPVPTGQKGCQRLVDCDKFVIDRCRLDNSLLIGGDNRFHLLTVLNGSILIDGDPSGLPLSRGQTALLPAAAAPCNVQSTDPGDSTELDSLSEILDIYLP